MVKIVVDPDSHRAIHRVITYLGSGHPSYLARFAAWCRLAAQRSGGKDDGKLLAGFAVAGVEDHVLGVGVDSDDSGNLAFDAGLFARLSHGSLCYRFAEIDSATGNRPVVVVGPADHQEMTSIVDHNDIDGGNKTVRLRRFRIVVIVNSSGAHGVGFPSDSGLASFHTRSKLSR